MSDTPYLIHNLQTLQREIAKEGNDQLATIAKVFSYDIPLYIEKLRRLEEYERGKAISGASKEADRVALHLHEPRHKAMLLRTIPD